MMTMLETYEIVTGDGVLIPHGELDIFVQIEKLELETLKCSNYKQSATNLIPFGEFATVLVHNRLIVLVAVLDLKVWVHLAR